MYPASSYCLHYFIQHFIAIFIHFCAVNKFNQSIKQSIRAARVCTGLLSVSLYSLQMHIHKQLMNLYQKCDLNLGVASNTIVCKLLPVVCRQHYPNRFDDVLVGIVARTIAYIHLVTSNCK